MKKCQPGYKIKISSILITALSTITSYANPEEFDCVIEPDMVVSLSSATPGIIETISVEKSDSVKKGQVLAKLQAGVEKATVELAKAKATFNGDIQSKKASLDYASRRRDRTQQLFDKKAISFDVRDEAVTQARVAKMALQQANEQKKISRLELQRAQELLERRTIRSPIDGIVVDRTISAGSYVKTQPILQIAKINPLRVETYAPSFLFRKINSGMAAEIILDAPMQGEFPATVTIVDKVVDAASGTFSIRLELPNKDHLIPAGLKCKVRFNIKDPEAMAAK